MQQQASACFSFETGAGRTSHQHTIPVLSARAGSSFPLFIELTLDRECACLHDMRVDHGG
jgi:hypothetical protein